MSLRPCVIEQQVRLTLESRHIEGVLHEQENVHVLRFGLRRHERAEYYEPMDLAGFRRNFMDSADC